MKLSHIAKYYMYSYYLSNLIDNRLILSSAGQRKSAITGKRHNSWGKRHDNF